MYDMVCESSGITVHTVAYIIHMFGEDVLIKTRTNGITVSADNTKLFLSLFQMLTAE